MERFVQVPYSFHQGYGSTLPVSQPGLWRHCKQQDWRQNLGSPVFLARPGPTLPANASESCVYPYKRAQLQAILTRMNPNLSLRLCQANTKDVAVQVSLRVDKAVQCSLGPQTLYSGSLWDRSSLGKPPEASWRRALVQLPKEEGHRESLELTASPHTSTKPDGDKQENLPQLKEVGEEDAPSPQHGKSKLVGGNSHRPLLKPSSPAPSFPLHFQSSEC